MPCCNMCSRVLPQLAPGMPAMNADALAAALMSASRINIDIGDSPQHAASKLDPLVDSDEEHSGSTPSGFAAAAAAAAGGSRLDSAPTLASPQTPHGPESADGANALPASQDASGRSTPVPKLSGSGVSSRLRGGKSSRMSAPGQAAEASALVHTVMANLLARYGHEKVIAADAPPPAPRSGDSTIGRGEGADSTEVSEFGEARRRITVDGSLGSMTEAGTLRGPGLGGPSEWAQLAPGAHVRRSIAGQVVGGEGAGSSGYASPALAGNDGSGSPLSAATPGSQVASPPPGANDDGAGASASASPRVGSLAARPPRLQTMGVSSRLGRRTSQSSFKGLAGAEGGVSPSGSAQSPAMTSGGGLAALTSPHGELSPAPTSASGAKAGRMSMPGPSPLAAGAAMMAGAVRHSVDAQNTQDASGTGGFVAGETKLPKLPPIGVKPQFGGLPAITAAGERGRRRAGELDSPGSSARQSGPGTPGVAQDAHLDQLNEHRGEDWTGPAPDPARNLGQAKAWLTFKQAVNRREGTPGGDASAGGNGGGADAQEGLGSLAPRIGSVMVEGQVKVLDPAAAAALEAEERAAAEGPVVQGLRAPMRRASAMLLPEPDMMALAPILSVDPAAQLPALPSTQVEQPMVTLLDHDAQLPVGTPLGGPSPGGASPSGAAEARRAGMKQARAWGSVKRSAAREAAQAMLGMLDNLRGSGAGQTAPQQPEARAPTAAQPEPQEPQEPQPWFSRQTGLNALAPSTQRRLSVAAGGAEQELLVLDSDGADTDGSGRGSGARNLRARGPGGAGPVAEAVEAGSVPGGADGEQDGDPAALSAADAPAASRRTQGVKFAIEPLPTSDSDGDNTAGPFAAHGRSAALVAVAGGGSRDAMAGGLASMVLSMLQHLEALLAQLQAAIAELKLMSEVLAAMLAQFSAAGLGPDSAPEARQVAWQAARKTARDLLLAYKVCVHTTSGPVRSFHSLCSTPSLLSYPCDILNSALACSQRDALLTAPLPVLETKRLPPLPLALPAVGINALGGSKAPLPPLRTNPMFRQRSTRRTGSTRRGTLPPMPMPGVLYSLQSLARSDGAVLAAAQSSGGAALEILHVSASTCLHAALLLTLTALERLATFTFIIQLTHSLLCFRVDVQHVEEQLETRLGMPLAQRKSLKRVADEVAAELVRAERAESRAHMLQQVASLRHGSVGHSGYSTSGYGVSGYGASGYGGAAALAAAAAAADSAYGAAANMSHPHQHRADAGRSVQAAGSHVSGTHRRGWGARRRAMAAAEEKWLEELPADEQMAALTGRTGSYAPGKRKSRLLLGGADSRAASRVMERDFSPAALIGGGREVSVGGAGADAMEAGTPLARSDAGKAAFKSGGTGAGGIGGLGGLLGSPAAGPPARMRLPPLNARGTQPQSDLPL